MLLGFKIAVEKYFDADLKVSLKVLLEGNLRLFVLSEVYTGWNGNHWYTYTFFSHSENDYNEDSALSCKYSRFSLSIITYYKISRDQIYGFRKRL